MGERQPDPAALRAAGGLLASCLDTLLRGRPGDAVACRQQDDGGWTDVTVDDLRRVLARWRAGVPDDALLATGARLGGPLLAAVVASRRPRGDVRRCDLPRGLTSAGIMRAIEAWYRAAGE